MRKITSKSGLCRIYLMLFILLHSMFTIEYVFSRKKWKKDFTKISYAQDDNALIFNFEFFDYRFGPINEKGYLKSCDFFYSEDGLNYTHLMRTETDDQYVKDWSWIDVSSKKKGEKIQFIGCFKPTNGEVWPENQKKVVVLVYDYFVPIPPKIQKAFLNIKWFLNKNIKDIKAIKLIGFWKVKGVYKGDKMNEVYTLNITQLMLNKLKNTPSVLNTDINDNVKVTREADEITVSGAKQGENIKVCTIVGTEVVKSVVVNSDDVNFKVAKNQVYVVTVGKASYKVAL